MKVISKLLIALVVLGCYVIFAESPSSAGSIMQKVMTEYQGVRLGMKKAQVASALGKPSSSDDARDEFSSDDAQITIHYDNGEVRAIQVFFLNASKVPAWTDVVGDAEISQTESGAKTARKVLSADNCWVSMYQNKDGSVTRITISR